METVKPETVGLSSARLERIAPVMQAYVDEGKLAGLITMLARRGQVAHLQCFGLMDIEANKPMRPDTILRIYSMTKPITSVAAMMLYEEGRFQLYDSVSQYLPEFRGCKAFCQEAASGTPLLESEREITILDLLRHTSGLTYAFLETTALADLYRRAGLEQAGSLRELVQRLAGLPLACQPGERWQYGMSTDVLGYLVEVLSGMPFARFLQARILEPLGMVDTAFHVPPEKLNRFAAMYAPADDGRGLKLVDAPGSSDFARPPSAPSGGGGLVGTASDYMRFAQMLLNGGELAGVRLLGRKTVELMTTNHLPQHCLPLSPEWGPDFLGHGFGLGFSVLMDAVQSQAVGSVGSYGWIGIASTRFWVDPREELIGLIMPQLQLTRYPFWAQFNALAYQAVEE